MNLPGSVRDGQVFILKPPIGVSIMIEEQKLVTQVLTGDEEAEEKFYKMFRPRLYRASMYFLGGHDAEAEDIVQDTFLIALPKLKDYDFCAPIYAWLRQICLRLCYARLRNRSRVMMSLEEDLELFMRRMAMERLENQDLEVQKQARLELINELKKQLNTDSRHIVELRDVQGLSYSEISKTLNIPIGTVMSRLARAREQLRKLVENMSDKGLPKNASR
jgi:RNA polymerase sigma-70 factor (ECF subfamily)